MEQLGSVELIIHRTASKILSSNTFRVYVDDEKIGGVYNDTVQYFMVSPSTHSIYVKMKGIKSDTLTFDSSSNKTIHLECGTEGTVPEDPENYKELISAFKSLSNAVYLKQVDSIDESTLNDKLMSETTGRKILKSFPRLLSMMCLLVTLLGFLGFMNGFLTAAEKAFWVTSKTELPLGDIGSIAADSNGNVYLVADFYQRVQKYSPDGKFVIGFPSDDNAPRIRVNEHDQLELAKNNKLRNGNDLPDTLSTYDSQGNVISEEVADGCYDEFGEECAKITRDKNGNTYTVHNKFWCPKVVKTNSQGTKIKAVKTPFHLWLIQGPFPAWLFFAVGLVILGKLNI